MSYAQTGEDLQIAYFVGRNTNVTYIDVGCLWPQEHSNSYLFYERGGSGLCIEPNPTVIDDFRKQRPRDIVLNCGISSQTGRLPYYIHGNPVFNTFSAEVAAEVARDAETREGSQREGRTLIDTIDVPVKTLDNAVEDLAFADVCDGKIDFLSVDVEGLELEVVTGFSFEVVRPRVVVVEHIRRRKEPRRPEDVPVAKALAVHGYWLAGYTGHDLYFLDG